MPRVRVHQLSSAAQADPQQLFSQLRTILDSLEQQLSNQTLVSSRNTEKNETGLKELDVIIKLIGTTLKMGIWSKKKPRYLNTTDIGAIPTRGLNFFGFAQDTTLWSAAATRNKWFPNHGDFGFYKDTVTPTFSLVFNDNGTTQRAAM